MKWYALLSFAALVALGSSALTQQELQNLRVYYSNHQRPCGDAQFSVLVADSQNYTLRSSGIPSHAAYRTSPYRAAIQELAYSFPREPVALEHPLCVPNGVPIGFALDGVPFYNPLSKDWNNAIEGSCAHVFDGCGGDVDKHNQYYYSELPNFSQQCLDLNGAQEAVHIGVAIDGFPIYYERRFNASLLDECGGRYVDTTNKRFYRYVVSNQFPYTLGCFRGKVHNISTLTHCKGHEGEYGHLCACVNVGPPGMAVGYKWLSKDAVTVGQCTRRPVVQERERAIICNRDQIPAPDFLEEDRRSNTCVDFRALYSLIVIQGHKGGLAPWTRLRNYGKEEDMEVHEEDSEYIQHFKALRWLLSDLHVLDYPELEKYERMMKNHTKPLCPKEQRKLRNALARTWVIAFLREAHKLRPEASDYEKEEVQKAYKRLMYVLKTLKALEIGPFVKKPEKKEHIDPWGIWIEDHEEDEHDEDEKMKKEEEKLEALISQLTALQTLGQLKEVEKKNGKKSEGGDGNNEMRAKLLSLLYEVQGMSEDGKHHRYGGRGDGNHGEGYGGEGYGGEGHDSEGSRSRRRGGEGYHGEGYGGEGHGSEGDHGEGDCGEGYHGEGQGGEGYHGEGYGGEGSHGEGSRGRGQGGEGYHGEGHSSEGSRGIRSYGQGHGSEGDRGQRHAGEGYGKGGKEEDHSGDDYEMHEDGMEGMQEAEHGMRRGRSYQRGGRYHGSRGEGYRMGGMRREGGRYHGREGEGHGMGGMRREGGRYHGREGEGMGGMRRDGGQRRGPYHGKEE